MSDEDRENGMIAQFQDITGQDTDRARFYLESSGWEVELALGSFYEANAIDTENFEGPDHEAAFQHPLSVAARAQNQAEDQSRMDQDPEEETEGVDTAGIDRLHKFQQDMNKIIEERDANSLVGDGPFQGSGNVLGTSKEASSNSNATSQASTSSSQKSAALSESEAQKKVNVDTSKPMTTIQVKLTEGGRLIVKLNENSTIGDLRNYVYLVRPETPENISIHTTFPNKEHTDETATLKDSGLLGAAIFIRLKSMPIIVN